MYLMICKCMYVCIYVRIHTTHTHKFMCLDSIYTIVGELIRMKFGVLGYLECLGGCSQLKIIFLGHDEVFHIKK